MALVLKGSHSFICTPRVNEKRKTRLKNYEKTTLKDGRLSWPWVAGWLNTEISVRHRELNLDTVAHLSANRARPRLTSLIEANAPTTTPDHQTIVAVAASCNM